MLLLAKMGREIQSVAYVACEIIAIATHSGGAHRILWLKGLTSRVIGRGMGGGTPWRPKANITVSLSDVRSKGTQGWLDRGKGEEMYRRRDRLLTPELALRCAG